jgi:4'-phosphopantetheinyl transferase EntD
MSSSNKDPLLERAVSSLAVPGVLIGHRTITEGDEDALLSAEIEGFAGSVVKVRRASGAARIVARELMARLGCPAQPVPRSASGAPRWPTGIVGSIAHDATATVVALASAADFGSLGIDIEPAESLDPDLWELIAGPNERRRMTDDPFGGRLLFAAKEAVYKAVHPLDQVFLEHHDVEVDLASRRAVVRTGRTVALRFAVSNHIIALALIPRTAIGAASTGS